MAHSTLLEISCCGSNLMSWLFLYWEIFHAFLSPAIFFQNQLVQKILSGLQSVSNSLVPDQARCFVGPAKLSVDHTRG